MGKEETIGIFRDVSQSQKGVTNGMPDHFFRACHAAKQHGRLNEKGKRTNFIPPFSICLISTRLHATTFP
ncbi:MAG: hypothetical protein OS112_02275 [Methanoregula sp.]|nr:MAG: hypothetical protein OS112_02275 [Methanoregula sp.]